MKSLKLEGKRLLKLCEVEEPEVGENDTVVTVETVSIGGSEYLGFDNPGIRSLPNAMGHGFTGVISDGTRVAVYPLTGCDNCVYCTTGQTQLCDNWFLIGVQSDGGFSQRVSIPKDQLFKIPDNLSWEQSVFIEPFANSINAWQKSSATDDDSVAVIGSGSIGMGLIACAQKAGCKEIHVAELSENRRNVSISLGATQAKTELCNVYDVVFDTVGSAQTRMQAIKATKKGGKCVFLGFKTSESMINMSEVIRSQKTIIGSFVYSEQQFVDAMRLVACCDSTWVKNIKFEQVEEHLTQFLRGDFSYIKLALRPNS